ncbi:MAG: NAD-dependent epimerase/dehydratase family protein [Patescibacteria group bacterium]|nr:NAD-dependent epimerase/dehydratase family protein [Patescibacteria group bacterium]
MKKHTVFITGAAGYVGAMLCEQFSGRDDIEKIIGLDKEPEPDFLAKNAKVEWITANTSDGSWQARVRAAKPDIIVHTAWQIREIYGNHPLTWKWNIDGSDAVYDFAFAEPSVERLVDFSTVSSYGAFADNSVDHLFTEDEPFRKTDYLYAEEKRICEEHLEERYQKSDKRVTVVILRPAAITGPRGRFQRVRFGLQATLAGQMKGGVYSLVSAMVSFVPVTPKWLRQFIHEDDVTDIVALAAFGPKPAKGYDAFNICPPGESVRGADMAKAVGKKVLPVYPWMVRIAFFVFWHLTRGKIPTGKGAWKGYSYPIAVDGSKLTRVLGYQYRVPSLSAFVSTKGRYEYSVPENERRA